MNEPAVFEKTDKTFPKSNIHLTSDPNNKELEHRNIHSLYGFYSSKRTYEALIQRAIKSNETPTRPF